jgi:multiple sugar transport system substrate-binding protein
MKRTQLFICSALMIFVMLVSACTPAVVQPAATQDTSAAIQPTKAAPTEPAAASKEKVTIKVMTFLAYDTPEVEPAIAAEFMKQNSDVIVELESVPFGDYFTKLRTLIAGGQAPDVVSLNIENMAAFASLGALQDLAPYIAKDQYDLSQYYESTLGMTEFEGKQYGLPASFSTVVLFYNKDLFDKAKISYPDGTWDWNKLIEAGKALTMDTNNDGITDQFGYSSAWWPAYLYMNGADIFSKDMSKCALTDPAAVEALQKMTDLSLVEKVAPTRGDLSTSSDWDMFMAGRLAMFPVGPWALSPFQGITTFQWDVADMPKMNQQATFLFGNALAITSDSKNKDAAWEYMKFAAGEKGGRIRQNAGYEISPVKVVAENEFLKSMEGKQPEHGALFMTATSYAHLPPVHPRWSEIHDSIWPELEMALLGETTVQDAMTTACKSVDAILAEK